MLDTYMKEHVVCPRCGKLGFLSRRWVRSSHYAISHRTTLHSGEWVIMDPFTEKYKVVDYETWKVKDGENSGRYRTVTRKYEHLYVGHYDTEKYRKEMVDYKAGKRKSRPNGRVWHSIRKGDWIKKQPSVNMPYG